MSKKTKKVPRYQQEPGARAIRVSEDPWAYRKLKPSWRLATLDRDGPWCYWTATPGQIDDLQRPLSSFESMTWQQIEETPSCGAIERSELGSKAQKRLDEIGSDVERLVKLRVGKAERVWGIRDGATLKVLWWDPRHEVYPMDPKDNRN